jgi:hypothetical protein
MDDVMKGEYSMTCVFLGDEGCNCTNLECNKHWGDDRGAKVCPHCGHTEQMWWASWVEHMHRWQASGQKGYFVYNASVKLGPGQRTEKQYLDDNGLEYEEVSIEQFHLIRRPDRRLSVMPIQHTVHHSVNPMLAGVTSGADLHTIVIISGTLGVAVNESTHPQYAVQVEYLTGKGDVDQLQTSGVKPRMLIARVNGKGMQGGSYNEVRESIKARPCEISFVAWDGLEAAGGRALVAQVEGSTHTV